MLKELRIGNYVATVPIVQGGMGVGISLAGLAAAVANEGGIGVIATAGIGMQEKDYLTNFTEANVRALKKEIQKVRNLTKGIVGVNIMSALSNFADLVKASIDEKIDIIFAGAGLPLNLPEYLKMGSQTKLVPIVSSGRAIKIIMEKWQKHYNYLPDAVVVEGTLAGGHLGFKPENLDDENYSLDKLVKEVIEETRSFGQKYNKEIPVIAAGGIYSGEDIYNIIEHGASGVQMGTRFVTTEECDASDIYKQAYLNAKKEDMVIIKSPVGMPGRAIKNEFTDNVFLGKKMPIKCPVTCVKTCNYKESLFCIFNALTNAKKGNMKTGLIFAGANAYKTDKIISIKKLFETLKSEYQQKWQRFKENK